MPNVNYGISATSTSNRTPTDESTRPTVSSVNIQTGQTATVVNTAVAGVLGALVGGPVGAIKGATGVVGAAAASDAANIQKLYNAGLIALGKRGDRGLDKNTGAGYSTKKPLADQNTVNQALQNNQNNQVSLNLGAIGQLITGVSSFIPGVAGATTGAIGSLISQVAPTPSSNAAASAAAVNSNIAASITTSSSQPKTSAAQQAVFQTPLSNVMAAPAPTTGSFWDKYKTPILIGSGVLTVLSFLFLIFRRRR